MGGWGALQLVARLRELAELRAAQCRIHEAADPAPPDVAGVRDGGSRTPSPLRARAAQLRSELVRQQEARVLRPAAGGGEVVRLTRGSGGVWAGEMDVSLSISERGELLCLEHRYSKVSMVPHVLCLKRPATLGKVMWWGERVWSLREESK